MSHPFNIAKVLEEQVYTSMSKVVSDLLGQISYLVYQMRRSFTEANLDHLKLEVSQLVNSVAG